MSTVKELILETEGNAHMIDITEEIRAFVIKAGIKTGSVTVFVQGSTGAVTTIEYEPNLVKDFREAMERIAPADSDYHHHQTWGDYNGHSHIRASVVGPSETIPVISGEPVLGTWQQIVVIDFDTSPRQRKVVLCARG